MSSRRHTSWPHLPRRLGALCILVVYLATAMGVACPVPTNKDNSQPYPCQNHACGCKSAEECWRHCCCMSPEAKLAWAQRHGIEPPAYAEKPSALTWNQPRLRERSHGHTSCAHCSSKQGCCSDHSTSRACCQHHVGRQKKDSPAGNWLIGLQAMACHGQSTVWISTGVVLPAPILTWAPCRMPAETLTHPDTTRPCLSVSPPDPPPRAC